VITEVQCNRICEPIVLFPFFFIYFFHSLLFFFLFFIFLFFGGTRHWVHGLSSAHQVLLYLSFTSSPIVHMFFLIWDRLLLTLPRLVLKLWFSCPGSWVAGITGVCQHAWLYYCFLMKWLRTLYVSEWKDSHFCSTNCKTPRSFTVILADVIDWLVICLRTNSCLTFLRIIFKAWQCSNYIFREHEVSTSKLQMCGHHLNFFVSAIRWKGNINIGFLQMWVTWSMMQRAF
jgi:hypothetical protein